MKGNKNPTFQVVLGFRQRCGWNKPCSAKPDLAVPNANSLLLLSTFTQMRKFNMSKILMHSVILLTLFGPLNSWASQPVPSKIDDRTLYSSQSADLAIQCRNEARQNHDVGVFPRKQSRNSAAVRVHSRALDKFCDAFEGKASQEFWDQISASKKPSERQEAFLRACLAEANGGRSTVFKPARQHIERMSSICQKMADDLPSE